MTKPLVSVLIDTYNQEHFIEQAIESVLTQGLSPSELEILRSMTGRRTTPLLWSQNSLRASATFAKKMAARPLPSMPPFLNSTEKSLPSLTPTTGGQRINCPPCSMCSKRIHR